MLHRSIKMWEINGNELCSVWWWKKIGAMPWPFQWKCSDGKKSVYSFFAFAKWRDEFFVLAAVVIIPLFSVPVQLSNVLMSTHDANFQPACNTTGGDITFPGEANLFKGEWWWFIFDLDKCSLAKGNQFLKRVVYVSWWIMLLSLVNRELDRFWSLQVCLLTPRRSMLVSLLWNWPWRRTMQKWDNNATFL